MGNINKTYTKDEAFKVLDLVNESIKHTDNKSAILVGLITLLIGLTTKVFEAVNIISNWNNKVLCGFLLFLFILYCVAVALSIIFSSLVFISRYKAVKYIKQNNLKGNSKVDIQALLAVTKIFKKIYSMIFDESHFKSFIYICRHFLIILLFVPLSALYLFRHKLNKL